MNFFDVILGMFVEPAQKVAEILAKHASSFFSRTTHFKHHYQHFIYDMGL